MLKIGEFSKLSRVSVKALRYYDDLGLLRPVEVDRFSGYRYYSAEQLPRLNRILALKDLGFSLDQIARLLDGDLTAGEIRGMLRMRQAELEQELRVGQEQLARVAARLRLIEQENTMSGYDVVLKKVEPITVAGVRDVVPTFSDVGRLHAELTEYLGKHQVNPAAAFPCMTLYHDPEYRDQDVDLEAAAAVDPALPETDRVRIRTLPAVETMACLVHRGPYEALGDAYNTLLQWIAANGYRIISEDREVYIQGPSQDIAPEDYVTEIQMPVATV